MENEQEIDISAPMLTTTHGKKLPQYIAAIAASMGAFAAGAVLGWTGNVSEDMKSSAYNGIDIDDYSLGWIGSLATLGATVACFPTGKLCDVLGRKTAMLLLTIPFMVGWFLIIFANSLVMLYMGRFLTGMAGCAFCVSVPIYTSEIAEKEIRGALGSYFELFLAGGILLAYAVPMIVDIKVHTIIMAILPLIFALVFFFQPESPTYMLSKNREKEAREALIRLRGNTYDVDTEIKELKVFIQEEENNTSLIECLKVHGIQKAIIICFSLMFFQQACGVNALIFYCDTIFKSAGAELDPKVSTLIIGIVEAVATLLSTIAIDRLGRRFLLINSTLFIAVSGTALGIFFTLQERNLVGEETLSKLGFMPITSLSIFIVAFSIGIGPVPWVIAAEFFPPRIKSFGTGAATTLNWFTAFLVTKFYLDMNNSMGGDVTFYIFSAISLIGCIFTYYYVPETKGKTLEEIQRELNPVIDVTDTLKNAR